MKKVLYFGSFDEKYARNNVIIKGLNRNNILVYKCHAQGFFVWRYLSLVKKFLLIKRDYNSIIVGFPGWYDLWLAVVLGNLFKKKVIFDVFTPLYETYFLDRKQVKLPWLYLLIDKINMKLTNFVLADTSEHLRIYQTRYGLNPRKGKVVLVGAEDDVFYPRKIKEVTDVLFYGSYQPLQGVLLIMDAATRLPKTKFKLIGDGQTKSDIEKYAKKMNLKNVEFTGWVDIEALAWEINKARIILGIFGSNEKAKAVIPNKVYQALACRKLVITRNTRAARELLINGENGILINNLEELVTEINKSLTSLKIRLKVGRAGYKTFSAMLRPEVVVESIIKII